MSLLVTRGISLDECIRCDDTTDIAESNLPRGAYRTPMVAPEVHVEPADNYRHGGVGAHCDEEETSVFDVLVIVHGEHDCEARDRYRDGDDCEDETMFGEVRASSYDHCKCECAGPGWDRVELCLNGRVAVRLHDCGGEEGVSVCWHYHTEVHQTTKNNLIIFEDAADIPDCDLAFCCGTALVDLQAGFYVCSFFSGEPFGILGKGGDEEKEGAGDDAG